MDFSFSDFFNALPEVLKVLPPAQVLMGLLVLTLPVFVFFMTKGMNPLARGIFALVVFFTSWGFVFFTTQDTVSTFQEENAGGDANPTEPIDSQKLPQPEDDKTDGFVFPNSDSVIIQPTELVGLNKTTLRIARNEIYARRGRPFVSPDLRGYFSQFSWYSPRSDWPSDLNAVELQNVQVIRSFENR